MSDRLKDSVLVAACLCVSYLSGCAALKGPAGAETQTALSESRTLEIAELYLERGKHESAATLFREVLALNPESEAARTGLDAAIAGFKGEMKDSLDTGLVAESADAEPKLNGSEVAETESVSPDDVGSSAETARAASGGIDDAIAAVFEDAEGTFEDPELDQDLAAALVAMMNEEELDDSATPAVQTVAATGEIDAASGAAEPVVQADDFAWAGGDEPAEFDLPVATGANGTTSQGGADESDLPSDERVAAIANADALEREWFNEFFETGPPEEDPELAALAESKDVDAAAVEAPAEIEQPVTVAQRAEESSDWVASKLAEAPELIDGNEEFLKPVPVPSNELDPLWRVGSIEQPRSQADDLAALVQAEQSLVLDAADVEAWKTVDELLTLSDEATKSLAITTLGQLPEACRAAVSQRMRTVLATDNTDDLKAAAALALGGLGVQAESAVPMLKHIVLTGGEQASQAAGVTLKCLGHEVPSVEAGDNLPW